MNWILISLIAQFILGTAAVLDKVLLRRGFASPWVYTFWSGLFGLLGVLIFPLGVVTLPAKVIILALASGALFILGSFFFFTALRQSEASVSLPLIGSSAPMATLFFSLFLLKGRLDLGEFLGFCFLIIGGLLFMGIQEKGSRAALWRSAILSATAFGLANVTAKLVFDYSGFVTGFIWMRLGGMLAVVIPLVIPSLREKIVRSVRESNPRNKVYYLFNRFYAAIGAILVFVAISQAHPALVDATSSLKYVVIFFVAWIFLKERFKGKVLAVKVSATLFIILGFLFIASVGYARTIPYKVERPVIWGVTFSHKFSAMLGLDWKNNFEAILNELRPEKIRLVAYWDEIENSSGNFNFSDLDWLIGKAEGAGAEIILVAGMKVPRWPECYLPSWVESLPTENREEALRSYLREVIIRYRDRPAITVWQIENEPFLAFGRCPKRGRAFLEKEIAAVKSLDPSRPVLVTDGGEFGLWLRSAKAGDIFGTTMYRRVYPRFIGPIFGVVDYHIDPSFFRLKAMIIRWLVGDESKEIIVVELQAEPWGSVEIPHLSYDEQISIYSPDFFRETIEYARQTGFDEYFLWGSEWWYYLKEKKGDGRMWEGVQRLFSGGEI